MPDAQQVSKVKNLADFAPPVLKVPTLTIELTTPVDDTRPVYLVGNFNNWAVEDQRFRMHRLTHGRFIFTFPSDIKTSTQLEYKYVRGGWENKELDDFGNATHNRIIENHKGFVNDYVPRWSNYGLTFNPTFLPRIHIVNEAFEIPQLQKKRKVSILLPAGYEKNLEKRYAVLYLHDAQNLFNPNSPYGNWAIDHKLAVLSEKGLGDIIIVAVDHAGAERVNEFLPIKHKELGMSEGKKYIRFISETLKPYIDQNFRTLPGRLHTGVGGSSMGGLITGYAGLMYPETFGKLMIFSPSLWVTRHIPFDSIPFIQPFATKIYVYAGGKEGGSMLPNVKKLKESIEDQGFKSDKIHFKLAIDPNGQHTETRWGEEFPKAVEWLFYN